jgi:hypothetical protein
MRTPPLKVYFALSEVRGGDTTEGLYQLAGARDFLFSFAYGEQVLKECDAVFTKYAKDICIILDSGAYSAWNVGKSVDLKELSAFCHRVQERWPFKELHIVNLDKIPGSPGHPPTDQERQDSAEIGSQNAVFLRSEGLNPIEVFHQAEDDKFLHRMIQNSEHPYIGVSPANDVAPKGRMKWLTQKFDIIRKTYGDRVRTHGFGVTGIDLMWGFPWTSVDSASYKINAGYGGLVLWDDSRKRFTCIAIGARSGGMKQMEIYWENKRKLFPDFITSPKELESVLMRGSVNAWAYLKARDYINEHYEERLHQLDIGELLK